MNYDVNIWNYGSLSCSHIMRSVAIGCEHRNFSFSRVNIIFYVHMHSSAILLEVHVGIPCKTRWEHWTVSVNKKSCEPDRIACEHEHDFRSRTFSLQLNMFTWVSSHYVHMPMFTWKFIRLFTCRFTFLFTRTDTTLHLSQKAKKGWTSVFSAFLL